MTDEQIWLMIAEAWNKPTADRTLLEKAMTAAGLCYSLTVLADYNRCSFSTAGRLQYQVKAPRDSGSFPYRWPMDRAHDKERALFCFGLARKAGRNGQA